MAVTYFWNIATGSCSGSASGFDDTLNETTAAGGTQQDSVTAGTADRVSYRLTTPSNVPNLTVWPAGTYGCIVDLPDFGNNIDIQARFRRVSSGCSVLTEIGTSSEIDPPSVGLNVLSFSGSEINPANASDQYQVDLLVDNDHSHSTQTIDVDYNDSTASFPTVVTLTTLDLDIRTPAGVARGVMRGVAR